jgi:hypothetical protein
MPHLHQDTVHSAPGSPGVVVCLRVSRTVWRMENSLHPNLARLAASYQQILGRLNRGELTLPHAHAEIRELIARDDEGVQWTINPRDGGWLFLSRNGEWMPAKPPASGFATMTPHDLRAMANDVPVAYNPDWDLALVQVAAPASGLVGSTRRSTRISFDTRDVKFRVAIVAVFVAALVALAVAVTSRRVDVIAPGPIVPLAPITTNPMVTTLPTQ